MSAPKVTVYLPARNRALLLGEAVGSVLAQDFRDFELIIVDDASGDATSDVAAGFAQRDPRVRCIRQPAPLGAPAARNRAIAEARGTFLTGIDDDDLMLPQRLAALLAAHEERYALVCSGYLQEGVGWRRPVFGRPRTIGLDALLHYNLVGNQALMLTERVRAVGGFDEALVASQDYDLWTRMVARYGPALRIAAPSYVLRQHAAREGISNSARAGQGAARYAQKHQALMNRSQRRSQRLLEAILTRRRVRLAEFGGYWAWATAPLLLRYWASGLPLAQSFKQRYRRLRWGSGAAP